MGINVARVPQAPQEYEELQKTQTEAILDVQQKSEMKVTAGEADNGRDRNCGEGAA